MINKLQEYTNIIEENINSYLTSENEDILESMKYSLNAGGKRIRPVLLLEIAKMMNCDIYDVLPYAISIEMIHTYSLIHDDLPCMDDDDLRRGKPTSHKIYGEALALLTGDALLNLSFEIMSNPKYSSKFSPEIINKVIFEVSKSTGSSGMISGQVYDIKENVSNVDELKKMHSLKTGQLIKCACVTGAILGGADDDTVKYISEFAINLGIAFQIKDDLLDVYGDSKTLGKETGSDANNNKITYLTFYTKEECEKMIFEYTEKAILNLRRCGESEFLIDFAKYLVFREK